MPSWSLFVPGLEWSLFCKCLKRNGGDDETRTRDLCRDRVAWLGFTTTYKTAGTAKLRGSRTRHLVLWVGKSPQTHEHPTLVSQNPVSG